MATVDPKGEQARVATATPSECPDDVLLIFVGHSDDAKAEAGAISQLEGDLQRHFLGLLSAVGNRAPFRSLLVWEWSCDAPARSGGQQAVVQPALSRAQIAVFIFRDRVGVNTRCELDQVRQRSAEDRRIHVLALFPETPPGRDVICSTSGSRGWADLKQYQEELCKDWNGEGSRSVTPLPLYKDLEHLKQVVSQRLHMALTATLSAVTAHPTSSPHPSGEFIGTAREVSFDRHPVLRHRTEELDQELVKEFISKPLSKLDELRPGATVAEQLAALGCALGHNPVVGAFLCFAPPRLLQDKFESCSLHLVRYSDGRAEIQPFSGNLLTLYAKGMQWLAFDAGLGREGRVGSPSRDELEIPRDALREALANALVHRDYENKTCRDQPTRIEVYEDRVEITSYGTLPEAITIDRLNESFVDLKPIRRNPIIARIFLHMMHVELNATGIARMRRAMQQVLLPPPKIIDNNQAGVVTVRFCRPHVPTALVPTKRVLISGALLENEEIREAAKAACLRAGVIPVMREYLSADSLDVISLSYDMIAQADAYVAVLGTRDGYIPTGQQKSLTELEYLRARERRVPHRVFLVAEPPNGLPQEGALGSELQQAFRENAARDGSALKVKSADDLATGLVDWLLALGIGRQLGALEPTDLARYREATEATHAKVELAGFQTRLRVPIGLEELHVPLHAMVDLRSQGVAAFANAEDAASCLAQAQGALDIALSDGFREAQKRDRRGLVILGEPGSGKTTQLKRLLLWLLREGGQGLGLDDGLLPVLLRLRELRELSAGLDAFIEQQLQAVHPDLPQGFGKALLKRGRLLLLFDGLDEVADPKSRGTVARWIEDFTLVHRNCVPVVTCRFAGYGGQARLSEQFLELHLRPLTGEQAEQFISNWYRIVETGLAVDPAQGLRRATENATALVERLRESDFRTARLVQMTRNPLLLANLCLVHRDRRTLPRGRARLYDECIEVLLERWREAKELAVAVSSEVGRRALQPAALWLHGQKGHGGEGRTRATAAELAPTLEPALKAARWQGGSAADFLATVRDESGLLTGWGPEQFGFMHLGFQEYLAASEVRRRASEGDAEPLRELAAQYGASWWQEVILVLLSMANPSMFDRFMREVVKQKAFGETLEPMGLILEEAVEVSETPFVELLREAPGDAEGLWQRQLNALLVLERMGAKAAIEEHREQLSWHPFEAIRARLQRSAQADQRGSGAGSVLHEQTGVELVRIPRGTFLMGSPEGAGEEHERPQHPVTVSEFYLGKYPVTNEQYARFLQAKPEVKVPEYWANRRYNQARQPVVGVSWAEAQAYAEWAGLRLATEAEWEYACRAGTQTQYSCGDTEEDLTRVGWFVGNSEGRAHEVGEKPPNALGLHDLHGNVWEWCSDWYGPYAATAVVDPTGPEGGSRRVMRGGSWSYSALGARSAYRNHGPSSSSGFGLIGFRLARGPRTSK